jgi:hypothetical protein
MMDDRRGFEIMARLFITIVCVMLLTASTIFAQTVELNAYARSIKAGSEQMTAGD